MTWLVCWRLPRFLLLGSGFLSCEQVRSQKEPEYHRIQDSHQVDVEFSGSYGGSHGLPTGGDCTRRRHREGRTGKAALDRACPPHQRRVWGTPPLWVRIREQSSLNSKNVSAKRKHPVPRVVRERGAFLWLKRSRSITADRNHRWNAASGACRSRRRETACFRTTARPVRPPPWPPRPDR